MDRKTEIALATLELAAEKGLGTVSMQQIADRVGITKASLYNHYSSKDEIVEAMYGILRKASKDKAELVETDYDKLVASGSPQSVLMAAISSYMVIVNEPHMLQFYKIMMSERPISPVAAEIMVRETRTMIDATRSLFSAMNAAGKADFPDVDAAAFSFAMAVHSIIDFRFDLAKSGMGSGDGAIEGFIGEFCRAYNIQGE